MMGAIKNWLLIKSFHLLAKVDEPFYGPLNRFVNFLTRIRHPERVRHLGTLHPDKTFYVIRDFAETVGLAGWYDRALGYLDRAERGRLGPLFEGMPRPFVAVRYRGTDYRYRGVHILKTGVS